MDFDRLLKHFDEEAGQKEQVALVFYYLENHKGANEVSQSDVKGVIQHSRSTLSTSSVSSYFSRLRKMNWITTTENSGYRLTNPGRQGIEELLDEDAIEDHRDEGDLFLDMNNFDDDERYRKLVDHINKSYYYRIYDATMVLTRKFFEDMVFEILKNHYAGEDTQMFYDVKNSQHHSFDDLLSNMKKGVPTLRRYSRELEQSLIKDLRALKNEGNIGAHSIRVDFTDEEVEVWSDEATEMAEILYDVLLGTRIADEANE